MREITSIWITVTDPETMQLCVISQNGPDDVCTTTGFERVSECWDFAKVLAKGAGLPETEIDGDVSEVPNGFTPLRRVK